MKLGILLVPLRAQPGEAQIVLGRLAVVRFRRFGALESLEGIR